MGLISALLGKNGIMACTWAVESVVINHLKEQISYLKSKNDEEALIAVESILQDEVNHMDAGFNGGGASNLWYKPIRWSISLFTEVIIRFGMR
jgi:ubiquinone biosynthesis monooxygenase Coq7